MEFSPDKEALKDLVMALRKLGLPTELEEEQLPEEGEGQEPNIEIEMEGEEPKPEMAEAEGMEDEKPASAQFEEFMNSGSRNKPVGEDKKAVRLGMTSVDVGIDPKAKLKKMLGK